ncbi:MAG: transglutaminase-like domain-containing protein [Methanobrevibacter sp.]|nr:transglutaminase-like domain-containing protein [Methanobrevibacter sp.]
MNTSCAANVDNAVLEKQAMKDNSVDNELLNTALDNSGVTAKEVRLSSTNNNANELSSVSNSENKNLSASSTTSMKSSSISNVKSSTSTATNTTASVKSAANSNTSTANNGNSKYIKASSIIKESSTFVKYVETNGKLPSSITINNKNYTSPQFLYLMCKALNDTGSSKIMAKSVKNPTSLKYSLKTGSIKKSEYKKLSISVIKYIDRYKKAPNTINSSKGKIPYTQFILAIARNLAYHNSNKKLASSIALENISNYDKNGVPISKIISQASIVKNHIEKKGELPKSVTIDKKSYKTSQYLYLAAYALKKINENKNVNNFKIKSITVNEPSNLNYAAATGTLKKSEYLKLANSTIKYMEKNKKAQTWIKSSNLRIPYGELVYAFSKSLDYYNKNKKLSSQVSIQNLSKFKPKTANKNSSSSKSNSSSIQANLSLSYQDQTTKINFNINAKLSDINSKINSLLKLNLNGVSAATSNSTSKTTASTNKSTAAKTIAKTTNKTAAKKTATKTTKTTSKTTAKTVKINKAIIKLIPKSILNSKYKGESLKKYLSSSTNCQVKNANIKKLAESLTKNCKNNLQKAKKIFNWVRDNIAYEKYPNTRKGAAKLLVSKKGNCVDQAHLTVALARSAGIPARYVNANNCKFSTGYTSGHVWAEFLIEDTWVAGDTTSCRNSFGVVKNWNIKNYKLLGKYSSISF